MSWCRWSSELESGLATSDLYIYDSVNDCITVHVAGRRRSNYADNPHKQMNWHTAEAHDAEWINRYIANNTLRDQWFDDNEAWEDLPDAYAGKNYDFGYEDIHSLIEFLNKARADGINFPDYVFEYANEYTDA